MRNSVGGSAWVDPDTDCMYALVGCTFLSLCDGKLIALHDHEVVARLRPYALPPLPPQVVPGSSADYLALARQYQEDQPAAEIEDVADAYLGIARVLVSH